jgi:hypothetical protein
VHVYDLATGWTTRPLGLFGLNSVGPNVRPGRRKALHRGVHQRLQHPRQRRVRSGRQCAVALLIRTAARPRRRVAAKGQFFVLGGSEDEPDDTGCYVGTGRVTAEVWAYTP